MSFKSLGLSDALLKAISKKGYDTPSPIQAKAIPEVLKGKDVLASAQTGTGKTAGFTLPLLQLLSENKVQGRRPIRALVLTPTRELAAQVHENVKEYSIFLDIKSTVIFGGVNQNPQVRTLNQGVDILVATPGRLLDLINQKVISLSRVEVLVLDEADRMLDMGFLRDIKKVLALVPDKKQSLLFSATFSKEIKALANGFLKNPILVEATPENSTAEKVAQRIINVDQGRKTELITKLIKDGNWKQVLIFTRTKHGANNLTKKLVAAKISAAAIHGNKSQGARTKALAGFKDGSVRVLVATDIAARGLDIPLLPHVINFELPNIAEDYVHRIGRTGRAGASGEALSLVCIDERDYLKSIEKLLGEKLPSEVLEGFEPVDKFSGKPASKQNQGRGRSNNNRPKSNSGGGGGSWKKKSTSGGSSRRNSGGRN
jgi:ATP-dependent RNA helicase RhlE